MTKYVLGFSLFISIIFAASAQENIPLESWRMHISYNNINHLTQGNNKIFAAAKNGIFYFDKGDNSLNTITKMNDLSDVGISTIEFSPDHNLLLIGYENGNLDLWQEEGIKNVSTILNANLDQSKRINHFNIQGNLCYISTDFGILIFNLNNLLIEESIQKLGAVGDNLVIHESTVYNDSLFLATQKGIIAASLSSNINILDFNNWKRYGVQSNAPTGLIASITIFNNEVVVAEKVGNIYSYSSNNWVLQPYSQNQEHNALFTSNNTLIISSPTEIVKSDGTNNVIVTNTNTTLVNHAIEDESGNIWIADSQKGMLTDQNSSFESLIPEGPFSDNVSKLYYHDNKIFALSGGIGTGGIPLKNNDGFYVFESGFWNNYHPLTYPSITNNLVDVIFNPSDEHYYFASYGSGILKFDGLQNFDVINQTTMNSPLESWSIINSYILVSSVASTQSGIWIGNYGVNNNPIHFQDAQQQWTSFSQSTIGSNLPLGITIAENGDKWIRLDPTQGGGVVVFNETTGKSRKLNIDVGNGNLPQNDVYDITIDKEGLVWLGTGRGVAYFSSTYTIENQNAIDAFIPIIEGFPLLRDERVTAIAIDGGNRKWVGSDNGLWLFDASGQNEVYYFNTENSPLISNSITDIDIHSLTGEVFIATENGLISFRSPATEGEIAHQVVKIFPNPVMAEFEGIIGISGLAKDAIVKITDISGKLIRQMRANGGTAGWNITDYNGRRAATGIYLVFSTSDDGLETFIGKIAVVE